MFHLLAITATSTKSERECCCEWPTHSVLTYHELWTGEYTAVAILRNLIWVSANLFCYYRSYLWNKRSAWLTRNRKIMAWNDNGAQKKRIQVSGDMFIKTTTSGVHSDECTSYI